jgi:hypothetical protein
MVLEAVVTILLVQISVQVGVDPDVNMGGGGNGPGGVHVERGGELLVDKLVMEMFPVQLFI